MFMFAYISHYCWDFSCVLYFYKYNFSSPILPLSPISHVQGSGAACLFEYLTTVMFSSLSVSSHIFQFHLILLNPPYESVGQLQDGLGSVQFKEGKPVRAPQSRQEGPLFPNKPSNVDSGFFFSSQNDARIHPPTHLGPKFREIRGGGAFENDRNITSNLFLHWKSLETCNKWRRFRMKAADVWTKGGNPVSTPHTLPDLITISK